MKKLITSILTFALVLFTLGATTFAWWNINNQKIEDNSVTVGTGAVLETISVKNTGGDLIPKGIALLNDQVNEVIFDYEVALENPINDSTEGSIWLEVEVENIRVNGSTDLAGYITIEVRQDQDFPVSPLTPQLTFNREMTSADQEPTIYVRVTLNMDENTHPAHVEAIKNAEILFDIIFTISDTDPN